MKNNNIPVNVLSVRALNDLKEQDFAILGLQAHAKYEDSVKELITNACGAVSLNVGGRKIEIYLSDPNAVIRIFSIEDNGCGIREDMLDKVMSYGNGSLKLFKNSEFNTGIITSFARGTKEGNFIISSRTEEAGIFRLKGPWGRGMSSEKIDNWEYSEWAKTHIEYKLDNDIVYSLEEIEEYINQNFYWEIKSGTEIFFNGKKLEGAKPCERTYEVVNKTVFYDDNPDYPVDISVAKYWLEPDTTINKTKPIWKPALNGKDGRTGGGVFISKNKMGIAFIGLSCLKKKVGKNWVWRSVNDKHEQYNKYYVFANVDIPDNLAAILKVNPNKTVFKWTPETEFIREAIYDAIKSFFKNEETETQSEADMEEMIVEKIKSEPEYASLFTEKGRFTYPLRQVEMGDARADVIVLCYKTPSERNAAAAMYKSIARGNDGWATMDEDLAPYVGAVIELKAASHKTRGDEIGQPVLYADILADEYSNDNVATFFVAKSYSKRTRNFAEKHFPKTKIYTFKDIEIDA